MQTNSRKYFLIFLLKYICAIAVFYSLILVIGDNFFEQYLEGTAFLVSWILKFFTDNISSIGNTISNSGFSVQLSFGCDGTEAMALFLAGVIAFKSDWKKKLTGTALGILSIYLLNLIRVGILFYVGNYNINLFNSLHTIYFPIIFVIVPILLLLMWIDYAKK